MNNFVRLGSWNIDFAKKEANTLYGSFRMAPLGLARHKSRQVLRVGRDYWLVDFVDFAFLLALFPHALAPLLLLAVVVPKLVEEHVLDLAAHLILPDHVQVLLGLRARYVLPEVVVRQTFNYRLEGPRVLLLVQGVVQRPADDRQDDGLNPHQRTQVHAVAQEADERAVEALAGREVSISLSLPGLALDVAVEHADAEADQNDGEDDSHVEDDGAHDGDVVLRQIELEMLVAAEAVDALRLDNHRREAVGVANAFRAGARLDKLGRDPQLLQVLRLLHRVVAQLF